MLSNGVIAIDRDIADGDVVGVSIVEVYMIEARRAGGNELQTAQMPEYVGRQIGVDGCRVLEPLIHRPNRQNTTPASCP
jgi:hypothetical protein